MDRVFNGLPYRNTDGAYCRANRTICTDDDTWVGALAPAQVKTEVPPVEPSAKPVTVEHIKIHGAALEGNLEDEDVDRDALVFLPPSYATAKSRRYPVVYALHGYSIGAEQWSKEIHVPQTIEGAFAKGAQEMIVVLPDSKTVYNGSMYSSSVTTGDFENYMAHDVVAYMDAHYRTIPKRTSRGLVGHSMGGYGASRIGMKHPDVFGSLYIMSPCCMSARGGRRRARRSGRRRGANIEAAVAAAKSPAESAKLPGLAHQLAFAAAWSPESQEAAALSRHAVWRMPSRKCSNKWAANAPLAFVDQYIGNLKQYKAIAMDVGDQDGLRPTQANCTRSSTATDRQHVRDLSRYTHQRRRGPVPEFRDAVLRKNLCSGKDCK